MNGPERLGQRNGSWARTLKTRTGIFSPELFPRYQRHEQALVLAWMEMVINGVSIRKVTRITEELCGAEFSKSTISALCQQLDPVVADWRTRS